MSQVYEQIAEDEPGTEIAVANPTEFAMTPRANAGGPPRLPWVGYFGSKTKAGREALIAAGVEVNQFYLFDQEPIKVKPFSYHLLNAKRYYTKVNNSGETVGVKLEYSKADYAEGYREMVVALVFVVQKALGGATVLTPATFLARSALVKAITPAADMLLGAASDPEKWKLRGVAHAVSSNAKWPAGRFVATCWGTEEDTKDGENQFNLGHCQLSPTPAEGVVEFNKYVDPQGDLFQSTTLPAFAAWEGRCRRIEKGVK